MHDDTDYGHDDTDSVSSCIFFPAKTLLMNRLYIDQPQKSENEFFHEF